MIVKDDLPFRRCVGIMLLNPQGHVFVAKRIDTKVEAWQMPQGGIDEGENPEDAAFRELYEETGIKHASVISQSTQWLNYDLPDHLIGKLWKGKYRGQTQKWFLMGLEEGGEEQINIATPEPEFSEWRWTEPFVLPDIIVPFKRDLYIKVLEEFAPLIKV